MLEAARQIVPSYEQAERFFKMLDPKAKQFTFQTFDDDQTRDLGGLARKLHTTVRDAQLLALYEHGAGVYVTVNETDGRGRCIANIVRVRGVWQEDDNGFKDVFPLPPSLVVESSREHYHRYWLIADKWIADEQGRRDFDGVMARMIADYGSDRLAKDISRVLRVPGFLNRKRIEEKEPPRRDLVRLVGLYRHYTRDQILTAFPPIIPPKRRPTISERACVTRPPAGPHQIEGLIATLLRAPDGERNSVAFWVACRLSEHAELSHDDVIALTVEAGMRNGQPEGGLERELLATAKSALRTIRR
jgi:hypothetical protein